MLTLILQPWSKIYMIVVIQQNSAKRIHKHLLRHVNFQYHQCMLPTFTKIPIIMQSFDYGCTYCLFRHAGKLVVQPFCILDDNVKIMCEIQF